MIQEDVFNNLLISKSLPSALRNVDPNIISSAEEVAKNIIRQSTDVDLTTIENIDLIVRPLAAVILTNEMLLENMFSETTVYGILKSETLPDVIKYKMLTSFSKLNGISHVGKSPEDLYSQISIALKKKTTSSLDGVLSTILNDESKSINTLLVMDGTYPEIERNKLSYVQINSSKAMSFMRNDNEVGTLADGGYNRNDRAIYDASVHSERIVLPGIVDVLFKSELIRETITVQRVSTHLDGDIAKYELPAAYYIDVQPIGDNVHGVISGVDKMKEGIVKIPLELHVQDGEESIEIEVTKYSDPDFESAIDEDTIETLDIAYRGKFPLLVDFKVFTKTEVDEVKVKTIIENYLMLNSGVMSLLSPSEIMKEFTASGIYGVVASSNVAHLYSSVGKSSEQNITFPLSIRDLHIDPILKSSRFSDRTISVFLNTLTIEVE